MKKIAFLLISLVLMVIIAFSGCWIYPTLIDPEQSQIANGVGFFNFPNMGGR
jgi:hypothetical protein